MTIAVYGASGYTGGLVLAELARRNAGMVLAGRDPGRLRSAAGTVGLTSPEIRVAGLDDPAALAAAFEGCDAVINCVAPFAVWAEPVIRAAIAAGLHYVDLSGEQLYVKQVFDTHAGDAERAGVSVVPMVNDGAFLADLVAHLTWQEFGPVDELRLVHRTTGGGGVTRGSGRTALASREVFCDGGLVFEDGGWQGPAPVERIGVTLPGGPERSWMETCAMAEVSTVPRHVEARRVASYADPKVRAWLAALTPEMVEQLPEAGPDETARRSGRFVVLAEAFRGAERTGRGTVEGVDTYGTTAVAAVEAALRLAAGAARPGVLAPAQAFDPAGFLEALGPHGVTWGLERRIPPAEPDRPRR